LKITPQPPATGGVLATLSTHPPLDVENQLLTMRVKWAGPTPRKEVSVRNLPPEKPSMLATFVSVFFSVLKPNLSGLGFVI
jgi:hypothetical protein